MVQYRANKMHSVHNVSQTKYRTLTKIKHKTAIKKCRKFDRN